MIVIRVSFRVSEPNQGVLFEHLSSEIPETRELDGCLRFELLRDVSDKEGFMLYEEWRDKASFESYKSSKRFEASGRVVFPLIDGKADTAYYEARAMA